MLKSKDLQEQIKADRFVIILTSFHIKDTRLIKVCNKKNKEGNHIMLGSVNIYFLVIDKDGVYTNIFFRAGNSTKARSLLCKTQLFWGGSCYCFMVVRSRFMTAFNAYLTSETDSYRNQISVASCLFSVCDTIIQNSLPLRRLDITFQFSTLFFSSYMWYSKHGYFYSNLLKDIFTTERPLHNARVLYQNA